MAFDVKRFEDMLGRTKFGDGFHKVKVNPEGAAKIKSLGAEMHYWTAVELEKSRAAFVSVLCKDKAHTCHVQFPITAPIPKNTKWESFIKLMSVSTYSVNGVIVTDRMGRVCLNFVKNFENGDAPKIAEFVFFAIELRDQLLKNKEFVKQLTECGLSTDLRKEADLAKIAGEAVQLSNRQLEQLAGGSLGGMFSFSATVSGLILGGPVGEVYGAAELIYDGYEALFG
jgi:hypothetical protein